MVWLVEAGNGVHVTDVADKRLIRLITLLFWCACILIA